MQLRRHENCENAKVMGGRGDLLPTNRAMVVTGGHPFRERLCSLWFPTADVCKFRKNYKFLVPKISNTMTELVVLLQTGAELLKKNTTCLEELKVDKLLIPIHNLLALVSSSICP